MQKRILVIDNDQNILEAVDAALSMENYSVDTSPIVEDIFQMIHDKNPDLILIDYLLYGINGGELCHMIKTEPSTAHLPVIIFSGYPKVLQSLGTYDCDAFISKPFDLDNFMKVIKECLAKKDGASSDDRPDF
ncbi:MAG: response regulator [Daejeonella sp.]|uniref:response regulator n=1 Tax=Daejeonella sp. TaxID=2805397 RepID=UPI003C733451